MKSGTSAHIMCSVVRIRNIPIASECYEDVVINKQEMKGEKKSLVLKITRNPKKNTDATKTRPCNNLGRFKMAPLNPNFVSSSVLAENYEVLC